MGFIHEPIGRTHFETRTESFYLHCETPWMHRDEPFPEFEYADMEDIEAAFNQIRQTEYYKDWLATRRKRAIPDRIEALAAELESIAKGGSHNAHPEYDPAYVARRLRELLEAKQ